MKYIGIDMGGTNIRIGLLNKEFKIIEKEVFQVLEIKDLYQFFYNELLKYVKKDKIKFISIAVPGTFDSKSNKLINIPNIKLDNDMFIKLEKDLKVKIYLTNDANSLLMTHLFEKDLEEENVLGFYLGTGFGSAIYINQKIYEGTSGRSGEIGHTKVSGNNLLCGCGNRGCLETLVSGKRLIQISKIYPYIKFNQLFNHLNEISELNTFLDLLAISIANNLIYFDINNVILGGGVITRLDFPLPLLKSKIYKHTDPRHINIYISETKVEDGIKGTVLLSLKNLN